MAAPANAFTAIYKLRFGDCDPAGIAFFPRLVEMVNWIVEDWCDGPLGLNFRGLHLDEKRGFPAVSLSIDFVGPTTLGDDLHFQLCVLEIGRSSVKLDIRAHAGEGKPVLKARHTVAYCDLSGGKPRAVAIEGDLRARMEAFRAVAEIA